MQTLRRCGKDSGPPTFGPVSQAGRFFNMGLAWQSMRRDPEILRLILVLVIVEAEGGAPWARTWAPHKIRSHALVVVPHQIRSHALVRLQAVAPLWPPSGNGCWPSSTCSEPQVDKRPTGPEAAACLGPVWKCAATKLPSHRTRGRYHSPVACPVSSGPIHCRDQE